MATNAGTGRSHISIGISAVAIAITTPVGSRLASQTLVGVGS